MDQFEYQEKVIRKIISIANTKIEVCAICGSEVMRLPPDGVSFCKDCDSVVEGNTYIVEENENEETV